MPAPAKYSFGADATRYGSDLPNGNSSYFLQNDNQNRVEGDLVVAGTLTVEETSALVGALTVGTSSLASPTTLNGSLAVSGASTFTGSLAVSGAGASVSAPDFQGTNSVDGYRASFTKGLISTNGVTISGAAVGSSTLVIGDSTTPGGNVIGYNGSTVNFPVNFPYGINGPASLTPQFRYIQIGADSGDNGVPTSPDGTQGGNNYWTQSYGGTELKAFINNPATSATSVYIVVLPSDFFTGTIPAISTKYYGKTLLKLWLAIVINSSVTVQFRIGSVTGTQVGRVVLAGNVASGWTLEVLASQASITGAGVAPLYYGLAYNVVSQSGGISNVPPT